MNEISKLIPVKDPVVDAFAERSCSIKIHCFGMHPCQCQMAYRTCRFVCVSFRQLQGRLGFELQFPPLAKMNERGRIEDVENDEDVYISSLARQAFALRGGVATLLVP